MQPTDKEELADIISFLNSNRSSDKNSVPYRILFLVKKRVPVLKKDLKLEYTNYFLIFICLKYRIQF